MGLAAAEDEDDESDGDDAASGGDPRAASQRLDKWLWFARVAKSRTLSAALVTGGKVRVNRAKVDKPAHVLKPGDVVTVSVGPKVRVLRMVAAGTRRGPAAEAQGLFEELTPRIEPQTAQAGASAAVRDQGAGRPTKRERRQIINFKSGRG